MARVKGQESREMGMVVRIAKGMPPEPHSAFLSKPPAAASGGHKCHLAGTGATVCAIALASGGIRPGGLIETDRK